MAKRRRRYSIDKLEIELREERRSSWRWQKRVIRGQELEYAVVDQNFDRLRAWTFAVRVADELGGPVIVQPLTVPGKKAFAGLERRAVMFMKGKLPGFRVSRYCKLNLSDPTGARNRIGTRRGDRDRLPKWFEPLRPQMRLKETVAKTEGTDGESQVIVVDQHDYDAMIRVYFAMRVWTLQEKIVVN